MNESSEMNAKFMSAAHGLGCETSRGSKTIL